VSECAVSECAVSECAVSECAVSECAVSECASTDSHYSDAHSLTAHSLTHLKCLDEVTIVMTIRHNHSPDGVSTDSHLSVHHCECAVSECAPL